MKTDALTLTPLVGNSVMYGTVTDRTWASRGFFHASECCRLCTYSSIVPYGAGALDMVPVPYPLARARIDDENTYHTIPRCLRKSKLEIHKTDDIDEGTYDAKDADSKRSSAYLVLRQVRGHGTDRSRNYKHRWLDWRSDLWEQEYS